MSLADLSDPQAINNAISEYDILGRMAFITKYGFKPARAYFLLLNGTGYDSKAIVGAAHGYQFPEAGPLGPYDFSGGEATVARKLRSLGFQVGKFSPEDIAQPIVLVENEQTEGGRYDYWKDVTGELYHFPNQYRNRVEEGKTFLYYRGVRRREGRRGTPEYFGWGRIAGVWRDEDIPEDSPKANWHWFARIEGTNRSLVQYRLRSMENLLRAFPPMIIGAGVLE